MRCRFCGVIFILLVLLAAMWLGARKAKADEVKPLDPTTVVGVLAAESNQGAPFVMTLLNTPCAHPSMQFLWEGLTVDQRKDWEPKVRAGKLLWDGKMWEGCWIDLGENLLFVDSNRDWFNGRAGLPRGAFKPVGLKV